MKLIKNSIFKNARDRNILENIRQQDRYIDIEEYQEIMIPLFENETQKSLTQDQLTYERLFQKQGEQKQFPIPFELQIDYITRSYFEFEAEELKYKRVDKGQQWKFRHFNEYLTFLNTTLNFVSIYTQTENNEIFHCLGVIKQTKQKSFENISCRGKLYIPRTQYFMNIYQPEMNLYIQPLGSTTSYFSESNALQSIRDNPKANYISGNVPNSQQIQNNQLNLLTENPIFQNHFNAYQIQGILQAHQSNQLFTLIDGPPGTGKTQTTLGLISTSFRLSPNPDEVILILARTNTVVNDLVRRIKKSIQDEKSIFNFDNRLRGFPWKIMRTGRADRCDEDIRENSMEIMGQLAFFRRFQAMLTEKCQHFIRKYGINSITTVDLLDQIEKECRLGRRTELNLIKLEEMGQVYLEMSALQNRQRDDFSEMQSEQLNKCNILVSTLNSCHQDVVYKYLSTKEIKFCIIDEAPTALESSMLIPITKYPQIRKFVLLGDVKQLNPFIAAKESETYGFSRSMFERFTQLIDPIQLKIQYRQVPILANITSKLFYDNQLLASETVEVPNYLSNLISKDGACIFFNSKNQQAEELNETSFKNEIEAQAIVALVQYLLTDIDKFTQPGSKRLISIIVAYRNQFRYLKNLLSNVKNRFNKYLIDYVEIDTIDAFQGKENDVVIVSLVRSGDNMGFLRDKKRMNVALSRARFAQFIFGTKRCLLTKLTKWKRLLDYLKEERQIHDYPENANNQYFKQILLQQNIINYVKELVHTKNNEIFFTSNNEIMDNVGTNIEALQIFELICYLFSNITEENSDLFENNKIITIVFASEQQMNIVRAILQQNTLRVLHKRFDQLVRLRTFQTFQEVQNFIIIISLFNGNQIGFLENIELGKQDKTYAKCGIFIFGKTEQLKNSNGKWNTYLTNLQANHNIIQYNNRLSIQNIGNILQRN